MKVLGGDIEIGSMRTVVMALICMFLLSIYVALIWRGIGFAQSCVEHKGIECIVFTDRMTLVLNTIQGLVSALIISVLAISVPGKSLDLNFLSASGRSNSQVASTVVSIYVLVWLLFGAAIFIFGHLVLDDKMAVKYKTLVDVGSSWFGLAVAAAYAFLGIRPSTD